jgi:ATP-dependent Clp protease protease subunit
MINHTNNVAGGINTDLLNALVPMVVEQTAKGERSYE